MCPADILHSGWGCVWLSLLPNHGQNRLWGWKNSSFEDVNQEDLYPTEFPVQSVPAAWFYRWAKPLVGITSGALQIWIRSANIHVLIVASPFPFSIIVSIPMSPADSPPSLQCKIRIEAPTKQLTVLEDVGFPPRDLFPIRGTRRSGRLVCMVCGADLQERQYSQCVAVSLSLLMWSVLASVVRGMLQPHLHVPGLSQYIFLE